MIDPTWPELLKHLDELRARALVMGGAQAVEKLHGQGKLTPRERIDHLLDAGSFMELGQLARGSIETPGRPPLEIPADGVVVGHGLVNGRPLYVAADDGTIKGGARGDTGSRKFGRVKELALAARAPYVGLLEGSARRMQETMTSTFAAIGGTLADQHKYSGRIPQAIALLGRCFGGPAFHAASSDFVTMVRGTSFMAMAGPPVVRGGMGEDVTAEQLGGAELAYAETGQIDYLAASEDEALGAIRQYLSFFPQSADELPPLGPTTDPVDRVTPEVMELVPSNFRRAYDVTRVMRAVVDDGVLFPLRAGFGRNLLTALARLGGQPIGVVASQPLVLAGVLDWKAAYKLRRFVELCDAFHVPLVFVHDVPGFLVGTKVERAGTIRYAVDAMLAVGRATVPRISLILRKSYGLAYLVMNGRPAGADYVFAWPSAAIALTGPHPAVNTIYQKDLERAADPDALRAELEANFRDLSSPQAGAEAFILDDIIDPADTRRTLVRALASIEVRRRSQLGFKHPIAP